MTARPTVGVLALQGDVREHLHALTTAGCEAVTVRRPGELAGIDGLVLPGGESTTISKLLRTFELLGPLQDRIAEGLPVYGSCAGMILAAREILDTTDDAVTLGAIDITVRRNAFGRQVDSFEVDLEMAQVTDRADSQGPVRAVFIRAPWVERVGDGVDVLATVRSGPDVGRVVAVRQGNALATSFHPEVTGDRRIHALFAEMVRAHR